MMRAAPSTFRVVWESAPKPTLQCPSRGLVTPDGCQECYVWRADKEPSWCRIGAHRRAESAATLGEIVDEPDLAEVDVQAGKCGEKRAIANEYTATERQLFESCKRVVARLEEPTSASEIVRRASIAIGRKSDGATTKSFAFAAARSVGMESMVLPLGVSGMRSAAVDAIREKTQELMARSRNITTNRLITEVAASLSMPRGAALAAAVKRARLDVINAR